ncbi:MAG: thermonuclease family protein [Thermodesulfobacteriota bacterium]
MFLKGIFAVLLAGMLSAANPVFHVARVIDGDTLLLANGERVRLIGVDTPELYHPLKPVQYFAKEASEFTRRMAEGKRVRLEYDWQNRDRYGRLLAYVYLQDSTFLNAEIIKQGYGFAYTKYPFRYTEEFRQYEKEARENGRGLWKHKERKNVATSSLAIGDILGRSRNHNVNPLATVLQIGLCSP